MKKRRRPQITVFSISFLDIISCAFAAVVMLVLLAKNEEVAPQQSTDEVMALLSQVAENRATITALENDVSEQSQRLSEAQKRAQALQQENANQSDAIPRAQRAINRVNAEAQAIRETIKTRQAALNAPVPSASTDSVGGIAVDAEYVLFIIDTSGSMKQIWGRVMALVEDVLNNHPQVKGFNFMSDNGEYLYRAYAGRWLTDNPRQRTNILSTIRRNWNASTNSSPVEGLEKALRDYSSETNKVAIYVFGDEFSGNSYDQAIASISALNLDPQTRQPKITIHGVGFENNSSHRFATLMRAVADANNGTFVGVAR